MYLQLSHLIEGLGAGWAVAMVALEKPDSHLHTELEHVVLQGLIQRGASVCDCVHTVRVPLSQGTTGVGHCVFHVGQN